jgi:hypothetical protein
MLPELQTDAKFPGTLIGAVPFAGRMVTLSIDSDGCPAEAAEAAMGLASCAIDALGAVDSMARQAAAKQLLPGYNSSWREFIRIGPNGEHLAISEPELVECDFMARLTLTSLEITGDSCLTLGYNDDHMFAGHSVFVTSFEGIDFTNARAELFG